MVRFGGLERGRCCICGIPAIRSLTIMGQPVCHNCEVKLSRTTCESEDYEHAVSKLKGLWDGRFLEDRRGHRHRTRRH